ncbi:translation initiation factor eIF-2B subunit gamma [Carex littledalei]|uniref:Translation initiation factor eIF2B subunit gamma n=1 Tax=Carex littledalei TaxID=544730 RepID=A0A833QAG7_9POAL|nr:translation initiation factor eIF-2B subunit gamma [Carex littledalei]
MEPPMDFQVVVLAGGMSDKLSPLVSKELPKALLPVANKPLLSYVLELLEASNLKNIVVVVEGDEAATNVESWLSVAYMDRLNIEVAKTPSDVGTVDAIRVVAPFLTSTDILIVSGDLVSDISPGAIAATHRRHGAAVTALLCPAPVSGSSDSSSSGGKDKAKKPSRCNIVGLDPTRQFLLHVVSGAKVEKDIHIQKGILRSVGQIEIRSDFMDAHVYAFKRTVLMDVLDREDKFYSIKEDVLPYLVRTQLRSEISAKKDNSADDSNNGATKEFPSEDININSAVPSNQNLRWLSQHREIAPSSYQEVYFSDCDLNKSRFKKTHKCCVYFSGKTQYCSRLNSVQAFGDINRDMLGEASDITGYTFSAQNNVVHPTVVQGAKTTTGGQCIIAEGTVLGDKCSVKRSVIGRHCRIGSNVKIVNSIVMNHVTIEDNCTIQGSVISSNVQIQERASLKDCQVGAGYVITAGREYKSEPLTKR